MKAIWLEGNKLQYRDDVPVPEPPTGEALVAVRLAGICATDLELVKGYYPYTGIPGHEFVGEIVRAPGFEDRIGERVVGDINAACGSCEACRSDRRTHCEQRTVLGIVGRNGAFAEYLCLPSENLIKIQDTVPDHAAVFSELLAAALEIQEQIEFRQNDRVLVIGAGRLGQLIAQTLARTGCGLQVAVRHPKQQSLLEAVGIDWIKEDAILSRQYDVVVEATGSGAGFELARRAVRPRGVIVLKSTYKGDVQVNFSSIVVDEITLIGSRCGPIAKAVQWLEKKLVDPTPYIEARYPLEGVLDAFDHAERPGAFKVLLEIEQ
jgi:2-desacetyl-2-hydroxyethyl bacteriochlorophyllide A dehydrogenase